MGQKITLLMFIFFMMLFSFGQSKKPNNNKYYEKLRGISLLIKLNRVNNTQNNTSLLIKNKEVFKN